MKLKFKAIKEYLRNNNTDKEKEKKKREVVLKKLIPYEKKLQKAAHSNLLGFCYSPDNPGYVS